MDLINRMRLAYRAITTPTDPALGMIGHTTSFTGANETGTRTSTIGQPIDTRRELSHYARMNLVKKSRWCHNQLGIVRRFFSGASRYAVGSGICHIPATRDLVFNAAADIFFNEWASNEQLCDVRGRLTFWRQERKVLEWMPRDGDLFSLKAPLRPQRLANGDEVPGAAMLQMIETHVCGSDPSAFGERDQDKFREGIRTNAVGRAVEYKFWIDQDDDRMDLSKPVRRPADAVMHILNDERATQLRGLPWLYSGLNSAIDIIDLVALEKAATKVHSALSGAIKKKGGDAGLGGFSGDLHREKGKTVNNRPKVTAYENFAGGAGILNLDLDEEFQLYSSNRPNSTWGGFIDFLVRDMAWGFGVSPEFIWSVAGLTGPNVRLVLEDAAWFFEDLQELIVPLFCRKVYTWVIGRGIIRGELPEPKDPRWWVCDWIGPRKITIDQGREGQLELDRLNSACGTWEGYWAARGESGRKMVEKRIDEIAEAMKYAESKDVPFEYILPLKPGAVAPSDEPEEEKEESLPSNGNGNSSANGLFHRRFL